MKILEASLNLRVDRKFDKNKTNLDYELKSEVAKMQLEYEADIYCNVEYMECQDEEYLQSFFNKGYKRITALFGKDNRGILCYVKKKYKIEIIERKSRPHFLHFRMYNTDDTFLDIIVFRILVSDGTRKDYEDRLEQWNAVLSYLDEMDDTSRVAIMGDWNHGYIREKYIEGKHNQYCYNYQKIKEDLDKRNINMGIELSEGHCEHSYVGYLAIDHIAIGEGLIFNIDPSYSKYKKNAPIGTPDHAFLFAGVTPRESKDSNL